MKPEAITPPAPQLRPEAILRWFAFDHLPPALRAVSRPFHALAHHLIATLPQDPERTMGLRKLLEAKDCAVRAHLAGKEADEAPREMVPRWAYRSPAEVSPEIGADGGWWWVRMDRNTPPTPFWVLHDTDETSPLVYVDIEGVEQPIDPTWSLSGPIDLEEP